MNRTAVTTPSWPGNVVCVPLSLASCASQLQRSALHSWINHSHSRTAASHNATKVDVPYATSEPQTSDAWTYLLVAAAMYAVEIGRLSVMVIASNNSPVFRRALSLNLDGSQILQLCGVRHPALGVRPP